MSRMDVRREVVAQELESWAPGEAVPSILGAAPQCDAGAGRGLGKGAHVRLGIGPPATGLPTPRSAGPPAKVITHPLRSPVILLVPCKHWWSPGTSSDGLKEGASLARNPTGKELVDGAQAQRLSKDEQREASPAQRPGPTSLQRTVRTSSFPCARKSLSSAYAAQSLEGDNLIKTISLLS